MAKKKSSAKPEFSEENNNLELVVPENETELKSLPQKISEDKILELTNKNLGVRKNGNIFIGSVKIFVTPLKKRLKNRQERFYKNSRFHLMADIVFVLIILSLAASTLIFYNFKPKAQIYLRTALVDEKAASGQAETFTIEYKNNGKIDIKNSSLSLTFPKDFALLAVNPENNWSDQSNTFQIGDLPRGANGQIKISGIPYGQTGSSQSLTYSLNYSQNGQAENTLGSYVFSLDSSALALSFEAPKTIYKNINFGGNIILKNNSRANIEKEINITFSNPVISLKNISSEKAALINGVIIINGLKSGETANIEYEASTDAAEGALEAVLTSYLNIDGKRAKQAEAAKNLTISTPTLGLTVSTDKETIKSGESVNFKMNFNNPGNFNIENTILTIASSDLATEIENFTINNGADKYKISGNMIELGALAAGASGDFDFTVILNRKNISANQQAGIAITANYQIDGRPIIYKIFSPKIKFNSNLQIGSKALYYSVQGDQLGIGPLPPAVDIPTKYWVFWEASNFGNALKDLTVSAELPSNVGWTGQKTVLAGDLRFGEISRKVIWTIDSLAALDGNYRAGFEIELIPRSSDLDKVPDIITNIKYSAADSFTDQNIFGVLPNLNADLENDSSASGKGRVVEIKIIK